MSSFFKTFAVLFRMSRPVNIAIACLTLIIGAFILNKDSIQFAMHQASSQDILGIAPYILLSLIIPCILFSFSIAFGNIHNDILDYNTDKINRPHRPLPSGRISIKAAKTWSFILAIANLLLIPILFFIFKWNARALLFTETFFLFLNVLLFFYNYRLKHIPLLKNMMVAFFCTTPLLLLLLQQIFTIGFCSPLARLIPAIAFAFFFTLAREIYKDLEDETGDLKAGIMTFPLIAGAKTAKRFAGGILLFTWILLPMPVVLGVYHYLFLILTLTTLTPTILYIFLKVQKKDYAKAQKNVKLSMFLGLISLVISALF
ncbi:MAG: UbiA family prenyltransferase [Fibrobacteraceae bacterium]|nr:UbiA family prenyltransferase [Fibrobacteraceae bacterium]